MVSALEVGYETTTDLHCPSYVAQTHTEYRVFALRRPAQSLPQDYLNVEGRTGTRVIKNTP